VGSRVKGNKSHTSYVWILILEGSQKLAHVLAQQGINGLGLKLEKDKKVILKPGLWKKLVQNCKA